MTEPKALSRLLPALISQVGAVALQPGSNPPQLVISDTGTGQWLSCPGKILELSGSDRLLDQTLGQ
jgi:hypothetical protein